MVSTSNEGGLTLIVSLARWLAIALGDVRGGTFERLRRAADAGMLTTDEHDELNRAFESIYALLFEREIAALRGGTTASTWINPPRTRRARPSPPSRVLPRRLYRPDNRLQQVAEQADQLSMPLNKTARAARTTPWREARWIAVDLETTGLDLRHDDIVSVGAVTIVNGAVDSTRNVYTLTRPIRRISPNATKVHGLRTDDVFDAPSPSQIAALLRDTCRGSTVIAHAAWIENAMLNRLARDIKTPLVLPTVDTAALARATGRASSSDREPSSSTSPRTSCCPSTLRTTPSATL